MSRPEFEEFKADDLESLNLALRTSPHVAQAARVLKKISETVGYPIADKESLQKALGDEPVPFGEVTIPAETAVDLLPNYYFPIESAEDLTSKMADFRRRIDFPSGENLAIQWAAPANELPKGEKPPNLSDSEIFERSGWKPGQGPQIGGLGRRE
jgi:hypothetical protein